MSRRMAGGVYWEWMTCKGRKEGAQLGPDYTEVRYEDLVANPRQVLARLSSFIGQELNYDEIQRVAIGSVSRPNTSFQQEDGGNFDPLARWKKFYTPRQLAMFEAMVGGSLQTLGYALSENSLGRSSPFSLYRMQYAALFQAKYYLRAKTPLGRLLVTRDLSKV